MKPNKLKQIGIPLLLIGLFVVVMLSIMGYNIPFLSINDTKGTLDVSSNPSGGKIYINNAYTTNTPYTFRLNPNVYTIKITKDGYTDYSTSVLITADGRKSIVADLQVTTVSDKYGSISFTSSPFGATVLFDGVIIGVTPITKSNVKVGTYRTTMSLNGYVSSGSDVLVVDSAVSNINIILSPITVSPTLTPTLTPTPAPTSVIDSHTILANTGNYYIYNENNMYRVAFGKDGSSVYTDSNYNNAYNWMMNRAVTPTSTITPTITTTKPEPPTDEPSFSLSAILQSLMTWLSEFLTSLSIAGSSSVQASAGTQSYNIDLSTTELPDTNYQDGGSSKLWGTWFVIDSNKNIIAQKGNWKQLSSGSYTDTATVTFTNNMKYLLVATIVKVPYTYTNNVWVKGEESIIAKESFSITVGIPVPPTDQPDPVGKWLSSLINWFKSIFGF